MFLFIIALNLCNVSWLVSLSDFTENHYHVYINFLKYFHKIAYMMKYKWISIKLTLFFLDAILTVP